MRELMLWKSCFSVRTHRAGCIAATVECRVPALPTSIVATGAMEVAKT